MADPIDTARLRDLLADFNLHRSNGRDHYTTRLNNEIVDELAVALPALLDAYEAGGGRELYGELIEAATNVLSHRVGDLPTRGWLKDNDASRADLAALAAALRAISEVGK